MTDYTEPVPAPNPWTTPPPARNHVPAWIFVLVAVIVAAAITVGVVASVIASHNKTTQIDTSTHVGTSTLDRGEVLSALQSINGSMGAMVDDANAYDLPALRRDCRNGLPSVQQLEDTISGANGPLHDALAGVVTHSRRAFVACGEGDWDTATSEIRLTTQYLHDAKAAL